MYFRPWRENDAEALYKYASDARVSEMALWPQHTSVEMSRQVIRDFFMNNEHTFAIVLKATDEPIGCIGLVPEGAEHYKPAPNEREVGYWIGYPYWGKGLTTEALNSLIELCRNYLRLDSLMITTDTGNKASQRVAEKCGFVYFSDYDNDGTPSKAFRLKLPSLAIRMVEDEKRKFMDLLIIGDESVDMIERYLEPGSLHVGSIDNKDVAVIVTVENDDGSVEIKNLAVDAAFRRRGIGRQMLEYVENLYPDKKIILGTGETPSTLRFYRSCGYRYSHRIPNFFTDNYPNPIVEEGVTLRDMVYLSKDSDKK
ncbi:MAG: GNAT family N-acetyltransferase [Muribaculaceae bacterium]|nr:GNAT family N-acetyltransferase [Muribaculaceae bacterium]